MLVITYIPSICLPNDLLKFGGISIKMLLKVHPPYFFYTNLSLHKLPLVERQGKKKNTLCVWGIFSTGLKKKLKNLQFILPNPMFTFLNTFDYFSLSTHSIFRIFLITFKVILCLLMSDIYHLQWIYMRLYMRLRKITGKERGKIRIFAISFTFSHYAIYFLKEYLQEKYTYEMILLF